MKKALVCCAALVASAGYAQSFELYGLMDVGMTRVSGLRGGTLTQLNSGSMEGSRWGLRTQEDLGSGLKVIMTLESRFEVDTGSVSNRPVNGTQLPDRLSTPEAVGLPDTPVNRAAVTSIGTSLANADFGTNIPGRLFDRQAFVGLVTPYGTLLGGRQYTPGYELATAFDIMGLQSSLSPNQLASFPPALDMRMSNMLAYRVEEGGLSATVSAAAQEGSTSVGRFLGVGGLYKTPQFAAGAAHNTRNNESGLNSLGSTVVGGSYNLGADVLSASCTLFKDDNPAGLSALPAPYRQAFSDGLKQEGRLCHIGYRHMFGANSVSFAYNTLNDKRPSNADAASYGLAYTYVLSKRTDLNMVFTHVNNKTAGQVALGGNGYLGGVASSAGQGVNSLAYGLRHRF